MEDDEDSGRSSSVNSSSSSSSSSSDGRSSGGSGNNVSKQELTKILQDEVMELPDMNIAVSGMAGRFPKSESVAEFEENLLHGRDMVNDQDNSRFTCGLWGLPPRAGRLKDLTRFDAEFFGYTNEESNYIDFQLRILYEVVYESIIDAGVNPADLRGTRTGVFFGFHCNEFENAMADDPAFKSNGYYGQFAVKVSQYFDFRGMSVTFDAACASGFVGLHNAVQAMKDGLIDQAVVCSSNIPIHPTGSFIFLQMQMLSPTGYSRFLDSRADGYVKSEACVSVLLQRKDLALRNYGSVLATMTSVDGYKREGITFPNDKSQERLIRATKELAGITTNHVEYLEAHGTGTPAGDPQEAKAVSNVYYPTVVKSSAGEEDTALGETADDEERKIGPLLVGSVKTNMGHSEAASGLCSLAKVLLMLENEIIYKGLHYEQPNTNIEPLMDGRLKFVEETMDLQAKIIPLSCYGFGGSNVHAIVRANHQPAIKDSPTTTLTTAHSPDEPRVIVMFGRSVEALNAFFDQLLDTQSRHTRYCLTEDFLTLVNSLNSTKIDRLMKYRGYLIVDKQQQQEARELDRSIKLCELQAVNSIDQQQVAAVTCDSGRRVHAQECIQRKCNLILPGLGSEWPAMAQGLQEYKPFWSTIERLASILEPFEHEVDLINLLTTPDSTASMLNLFVTIVAYQIALINMVRDQLKLSLTGNIVGHSLGEISCAYATGLFNEREAIVIAYHLGKTLDENKHLIGGKMAALGVDEQEALKLIEGFETVRVSCINGPQSVTVSGCTNEMDRFCSIIQQKHKNVFMKELNSSIALHNEAIMTPKVNEIIKLALQKVIFAGTNYDRGQTNWLSSVDGEQQSTMQINAEYFANNICKKVDFLTPISLLQRDSIALELGPSGLFASQFHQLSSKLHHVVMMKRSTLPEEQPLVLVKSIGQLYQAGVTFDLNNFYHHQTDHQPVRRQTPSLSSLFKWNHESSLFVPRYPIHFSKSSAKCELPVDIVQDRDKFITGHCIEGRVLYPATGYLFIIWRVFSFTQRKIYDACFQDVENELVPIEFHNVRLMRAVLLSGNRAAQIYIHYEEGTGKFEIKEGGSVVVEGYARSPVDSPKGLLYEQVRERLEAEKLELTLSADDVYKQFRVSGYDYGETFRCIEAASSDGRRCRVKYNGHFIALTDSILQSIFLAVSQYAPSGGLFLPTRFDYIRFQPEVILEKLHKASMKFDLSDGSLNTMAKRDIMTKMMQRESGQDQPQEATPSDETNETTQVEANQEEPKAECIFETYCDPITGIIITDGIEMRGIKASPAPRRSDNNEVLLESYQFVKDCEDPVEDENLTKFNQVTQEYVRMCDHMSTQILADICGDNCKRLSGLLSDKCDMTSVDDVELEEYKSSHLTVLYNQAKETNRQSESAENQGQQQEETFDDDIKKNGDRMLMSVLDQLKSQSSNKELVPKVIKELVQQNRLHLMHDLIQKSFTSERFMRPLVETVIENICQRKKKLRILEINQDDGIMKDSLQHLCSSVEPGLSLEYSLAHPDINRLTTNKLLDASGGSNATRTFKLKSTDLQELFSDEQQQLQDLDLIVYKDISCYSVPKQVIEQNGLAPVLTSLNVGARMGGFVMVVMRQKLTLAERVLLSLSEPELVGLSKQNLDQIRDKSGSSTKAINSAVAKIELINTILASRIKQMLSEAERNKMICVAKKSDYSGCTVLLFKTTFKKKETTNMLDKTIDEGESSEVLNGGRVLLRVSHDGQESIENWLEQLKSLFKKPPDEEPTDEQQSEEREVKQQVAAPPQVWLCAVATKQNPVSGLIGFMRSLMREFGSSRLRCYYDCHTFKNKQEPITLADIEQCEKFQLALIRNMIWNCVDSQGNFGSYRHFTITNFMRFEDCQCNDPTSQLTTRSRSKEVAPSTSQACYVNNATRGDLSSFTWFEAPFKYLNEEERKSLVRVAYSALNFRDIMLATGRLPLDAIPIRLAMADCLLGLEFSGFDVATNKRVMGMVFGRGIATQVICPAHNSIRVEIPDWLDLKEAATIPVVYATAIMSLIYRGRMQRGESILIHAGSGGVGQAAIRLALHYGLEVYTTVGTDEKRDFLLEEFGKDGRSLTEDRIFSSRDCTFEEKIMLATKGRGVDLVLNSLADDKLQASVRCLADGGRFLEIGKYDMSTDAQLELLRLDSNKTFHGILLDKLFDTDDMGAAFKQQLRCVLSTLKEGLELGYIKPIKYTMFKRNQIEEAFRFMATGKHIGKILIEVDASNETIPSEGHKSAPEAPVAGLQLKCVPRFQLSPEKSYIVTGGLGGFGMELTKWLVNQGARNILLTSRSGLKTGYQKSTLERLEKNNNVKFLVVTNQMADASLNESGASDLCQLALDLSPSGELGGIFHLAMLLKDTLLENMSAADFELVCRPKVNACVHLDAVTRRLGLNLDYFVAFSSVTSGKGNAGQANYAYANSCLERVCEQRRQLGLHGLAIQWGAIGDVGVAFENLGGNDVVIGGTIPQRMPSCLSTLAKLLCSPFATCLSVVPVNRSADGSGDKGDLVGAVMHVLGIKDPSKVSELATLGELGLDSLMAVEIRQYIEREYDMTLNIQEIRSLTIAKIRSISENERPKKATGGSAGAGETAVDEKPREAQSYGSKLDNNQQAIDAATDGAKDLLAAAAAAKQAMLDKNMVNSFKPQLELPKDDFIRLNHKHLALNGYDNEVEINGQTDSQHHERPIFFIPPIHGEFDRLEAACASIKRPCIGLNWTRKLGRVKTVAEAVEVYLDLLERADWSREFHLNDTENGARTVDLVGYSFGATIAFEMMLTLHKRQRAKQNRSPGSRQLTGSLSPGSLVLLDGSPKQIELSSQFMSNLTQKRPLKLSEKVDELLMVYVISHTRSKYQVDYLELQRALVGLELEQKVELASKRLAEILGFGTAKSNEDKATEAANELEETEDKQVEIAHAMEAFCRRYELMSRYKASLISLPADCVLIRAEQLFLTDSNQSQSFNEDLDLSSVVGGKVHLFVMKGNHETFLDNNHRAIGDIITRHCVIKS